jgi:amylosucrase
VGNLLGLYNVTGTWRPFSAWRLDEFGLGGATDVLAGEAPEVGDDGNLWLAPYQARWLVER